MTPAPACSSCAALATVAGSASSARDGEIRPPPGRVTGRLGTGRLGTGRLGMVLHSTRRGRTAAWRSFSISDSGNLRAGRSDRVQAGRGEHRADPVDLPGGRRGHFGAGIVQAERRVLGGTEQVEREHVDPFDVPEGRDEPGEGGDVAWVVGPAGDEDETHPDQLVAGGEPTGGGGGRGGGCRARGGRGGTRGEPVCGRAARGGGSGGAGGILRQVTRRAVAGSND